MSKSVDLQHLIHLAYSSAGSKKMWPDFLQALTHFIGADGAWLHAFEKNSSPSLVATSGFEQSWMNQYQDHYCNHNPYIAAWNRVPLGKIVAIDDVLSNTTVQRSEFYCDFISPQSYRLGGTGTVFGNSEKRWGLTCHWTSAVNHRQLDHATTNQQEILAHLETALNIHLRLETLERRNEDLAQAIELSQLALCVCDATGRIFFSNAAAERIFRQRDGLLIQDGRLHSLEGRLAGALHKACQHSALLSEQKTAAPPSSLSIPCPNGDHYQLLLCPIVERHAQLHAMGGRTLVFLQKADNAANLSQRLLGSFYGLTGQEARVARHLARGTSASDIAEKLNITKETLKSHLRVIYHKTDTRRQAQLVAKLLSGLTRIGAALTPDGH